ncbi:MAG: hypothetical protein CL678_11935 [Bdellovibrionaceae bacterium]|nr:hypothetical protein [Pseudobdellovibrionaceae bacterium]|tara:strand:- start:4140 stop:4319 length:180 start_codon:yes stop_codon:yes gene_type:complete
MALLKQANQEKLYDVRLLDKNKLRGFVSAQDSGKIESSLSDDSENAEWVSVEELSHSDD